eukprot:gene13183-13288_t
MAPDKGCTHSYPVEVRDGIVHLGVKVRAETSVERAADGAISVKGDEDHPANFGRLCSKGSALAETLSLEGRLLEPKVQGKATSWDPALDLVAKRFSETIRDHGPDTVAFYVSGQLLTEDYYVINKLAKGFVGTANIDTNSRLCMASSVAGHKRAFGADIVPGCYEDLEQADMLVLVGSNAAWCHPVLYQRMMAAKAKNPAMRLVVIDPRRTDTVEGADLHLALRSGSDAVLFNGLLQFLEKSGQRDVEFVENHTTGVEGALGGSPLDIAKIASICGIPDGTVQLFFDWFAKTEKVVTLYSQGINQSTSGTDKVNAIINCHLLTGRIGRAGMGPFSLTGQPNAMGGREVGGLANQLAAHLDLENADHRNLVQRFWNAPQMAEKSGLKAVDMFDAVAAGKIKAIWIISTNPLVSLPDSDTVKAALDACDFVVVSDIIEHTDTNRHAHVLLPATGWGEKDGTVTNSERRMSRQRRFLAAPGKARADWQIICDIAKRMGFSGFDFATPLDVFKEHAALSGFENNGQRDFDISGLQDLAPQDYETFTPVQWPVPMGQHDGTARFFGAGRFYTPDRKARFLAIAPRVPKNPTSGDFPLVLNTGRIRDQWHTMTRTGKSRRLSSHIFEPYAEFQSEDAKRFGLEAGGLCRLTTEFGAMVARVNIANGQRRGCVFVPMHWNGEFASDGRVNTLVNPAVDPVSGQPESKHTPVRAEAYVPKWQAVILSRLPIAPPKGAMWVSGLAGEAHRLEFWGETPMNWDALAASLQLDAAAERVQYSDPGTGAYRTAYILNGQIQAALFVAQNANLPSRSWLSGLFTQEITGQMRMSVLAGRALDPSADIGAIVCSCFGIGRNQINSAIIGGITSVEQIGQRLKAGTNCGSCKPELAKLLTEQTRH